MGVHYDDKKRCYIYMALIDKENEPSQSSILKRG